MFSYYGSKSKIVELYPPPKHKRIIEPFAGSARYSLKYWQNDVLLIDKYETIVNLWNWLKSVTPNDILNLPNMGKGEDLRLIDTPIEAKILIGFCINRGSVSPKNISSGFNNWNEDKKRIAKELHKIKHWEIKQGCYTEIENETATWFIDPPYQFGGQHYKKSADEINFNDLGIWCMGRYGQSIVCENTKANWLKFKPVIEFNGAYDKTTEAIWSNHKTNYDNVQGLLFE